MNETVSQKKDINTGSEILSVHVGLPEKLDLETPFQDTGSCGILSLRPPGKTISYAQSLYSQTGETAA